MLKQYKILINEGKGSDNALITVPAGAGARGNPTRITAKPDTRYELQDELKGKGLGPDQVRGKRVGKNLYLMFEDNGKPDIIIEGYYDPANLQQVPTIVGKAENGSIYEYIPHDPELSSMSTTLKDSTTPAMLSLGGGPIAGGAFELAGLPLVAAAAGGGLGGLGLLAAGLGAAALGGGGANSGAGGGGTAVAPNGGVAPTITIATDKNNDGVVNKTELDNASTFAVTAVFDKTKVAVGDKVVFSDGGSPAVVKTVTLLNQSMIDDGAVTVQFDKPVEGATLTVNALIQRDATNSASESDSAKLDTTPPAVLAKDVFLDPSSDTGKKLDLITDVDKPTILVTAEKDATVNVSLLAKEYPAKLNSAGQYAIEVTDFLKPGLYTPNVTVTDKAGNITTFDDVSFVVTKVTAANDFGYAQAGGGLKNSYKTTATTGNLLGTNQVANGILSNDSDAYYYSLNPPKKDLTVQSVSYLGKSLSFGVEYEVNYGAITIKADGTYLYKVDISKSSGLNATSPMHEIFAYTVISSTNGLQSTATLDISVYADANPSAMSLQYNGATPPGPILGQNSLSFGNSGSGGKIPSNFLIKVADADDEQSYLDIPSDGILIGASGNGFFSFKLDNLSTAASHLYEWSYTLNSAGPSNITIRDLVTVSSLDGNSFQTLQAVIADAETSLTNSNQYFYTTTAKGLNASGVKTNSITDTLFLKSDGLILDLTAATTRVSDMEVFNITGTGQSGSLANTIRIDFQTVTQSMGLYNGNKALYIIGDGGDKVQLVGAGWSLDNQNTFPTGYKVYINTSDTNYKLMIDTDLTLFS